MGVDKITITCNRHGQAGRMLEINALENIAPTLETGMGHRPDTQRMHYDDTTHEQGVFNIARANAEYLAKENTNQTDATLAGWQEEKRKEQHHRIAEANKNKKAEEYLEKVAGGISFQTSRRKLKSEFRLLHFVKVYSWSNPEFSSFVFCSQTYPNLNSMHKILFERFFYTDSMEKYRRLAAEALLDVPDENFIDRLLKLLKTSLNAWNLHRLRKEHLHAVLNFHGIESRMRTEMTKLRRIAIQERGKETDDEGEAEDRCSLAAQSADDEVETVGGGDVEDQPSNDNDGQRALRSLFSKQGEINTFYFFIFIFHYFY
jgi:hypothetical protein